jgi:hypothetical protein
VADRLDVGQRLAEASVAVEHTQTYVRACQALGYANPELTSRPSRIREQFDSEGGLDLRALDRDCAELRAAGDAIAEGLRIQRAQAAELAAAWTGPAGEAAGRFLQRHCDAANMVATEVRAAAQRCESLRDNLWYLLDSKVATAIAIDDRTQPQRAAWLGAAAEVTGGAGPGSTAEQIVGHQVMPYVDNDIRNDWLDAMRSSQANFATSYDMVINRMAATPAAFFDSPADLGPGLQPLPSVAPSMPAVTSAVTPAAATVPTRIPANHAAAQGMTTETPATMPETPAPELGSALGDTSALPASAGGLGDMGAGSGGLGGLGGLASRIVDAMTGLLGSAGDDLGDPSALDDSSDSKDPFGDDTSDKDPFHPDDEHADADHEHDGETEGAEQVQPVDGPPPADVPTPVAASPPPPGETPPAEAPSPAAAPTGGPVPRASGSTPCEIAADQLPQAGQ